MQNGDVLSLQGRRSEGVGTEGMKGGEGGQAGGLGAPVGVYLLGSGGDSSDLGAPSRAWGSGRCWRAGGGGSVVEG